MASTFFIDSEKTMELSQALTLEAQERNRVQLEQKLGLISEQLQALTAAVEMLQTKRTKGKEQE